MYINPRKPETGMSVSTVDESITVNEWLTYWLETYIKPTAKPSGYESYQFICLKHICPKLGEKKLSEVTPGMLQSFLNKQAARGNHRTGGPLSAKTVRNIRVVLDVAFKQAIAEEKISANPVPLTAIKSAKHKRVQTMTDTSQEILERYLFENKHHYHAGILIALYTGMRLGEVCALKWKDYDEEAGTLQVVRTVRRYSEIDPKPGEPKTRLVFNDTKTESSERILVVPDVLKEVFKYQRREYEKRFGTPTPEDFILFSKIGYVLDPDNLSHYFARLLDYLGIEHIKFHALRHTFATRAVEKGIDVATVSGLLVHADVTTTTHFYVHPREAAMAAAMKNIAPIYSEKKNPVITVSEFTEVKSA